MKAIILAAGRGTRLKPLTLDKPKCLVELRGRPLLEYQLPLFSQLGIQPVIVTGYKSELLKKYSFSQYRNDKYETTNMVYSFFCARNEFDDDIIISYGDIIFEKRVLTSVMKSQANISVVVDSGWKDLWALRMENPLSDAETLILDKENCIVEIGKSPQSYSDIQGQYVGLIKISKKCLEEIVNFYEELKGLLDSNEKLENMFMTNFLQLISERLMKVKAVSVSHGWLEVDTLKDWTLYEKLPREKYYLFNFDSF